MEKLNHATHKETHRPRALLGVFLGLLAFLVLPGCQDPCDTLVERLCEHFQDPNACSEWEEVARTAGPESCEESLKVLKATLR